MVKLLYLPVELLSQILHYYGGSAAVVSLWRCGDTMFNQRMTHIVSEIDLEDCNAASTSRYPKMLSSLSKLRILRISRRGWLGPSHILSEELQKLSPTLRELEIRSSNGISPLRRFPANLNTSQLQETYVTDNARYSFWNVGAKFPNLLKLAFWSDLKEQTTLRIDKELYWYLPPLLQHLELSVNLLPDSMLPDALQTLKTLVVPHMLKWPTTLTNIIGAFPISTSTSFNSILRSLPPGLKTLPTLHLDHCGPLSLLPASLESLHITSENIPRGPDLESIARLPLTQLSIPKLNALVLCALPRSLTSLQVDSIEWHSVHHRFGDDGLENWKQLWPPNLLKWSIPRFYQDVSDHKSDTWFNPIAIVRSLPSSITEISALDLARGLPSQPISWDVNLPSLRSLHASFHTITFPLGFGQQLDRLELSLDTFDIANFELLSASPITTLDLRFQFASRMETGIHSQFVSLLPKKLKTLSLLFVNGGLDWTSEAWSQLPTSLTSFKLLLRGEYELAPSTSEVLPYMPPNLTELSLTLSNLPTSADLLSLPCYANLRRLNFRFDTLAAKMNAEDVLSVWPESSLMLGYDPGSGWGAQNSTQLLLQKTNSLRQRAKVYPDPRTN